MYKALIYFETLFHHFRTSQIIKDIYTEQGSWLVPLTALMAGGVMAGPVGAIIGAVGGTVLAGPRKQEFNMEYESMIVLLGNLDYDEQLLLVGIVQGTLGSCQLSELNKCLNNRRGANKVIEAVKMFKAYMELNN